MKVYPTNKEVALAFLQDKTLRGRGLISIKKPNETLLLWHGYIMAVKVKNKLQFFVPPRRIMKQHKGLDSWVKALNLVTDEALDMIVTKQKGEIKAYRGHEDVSHALFSGIWILPPIRVIEVTVDKNGRKRKVRQKKNGK